MTTDPPQTPASPEETLRVAEELLRQTPENEGLRRLLAKAYFELGCDLMNQTIGSDNVDQILLPIQWFEKAIEMKAKDAEIIEYESRFKIAIIEQVIGLNDRALPRVAEGLAIQERLAQKHPLGSTNIRFLSTRSGTLLAFGHLLTEPDVTEKRKRLGWMPNYRTVMLAERGKVVNETALKYARSFLCAITEPALVRRLLPLVPHLECNSFWIPLPNKEVVTCWDGITAVQEAWDTRGFEPLYKLTREHRKRGWKFLENFGVPHGSWFVTIHVRDQSYSAEKPRPEPGQPGAKRDRVRDASISTYIPAIEEIVRRGGWVIRIGDKSMEPLPAIERVIDYAFSPLKNGWFDIFLGAACRFFIGCASGPAQIATNFGVPLISTNTAPGVSHSPSGKDLSIPKLLRRKSTGQLVSFRELLAPPLGYIYHANLYPQLDLEIIDNSPEEIREVVIEMLDIIDGKASYTPIDNQLQAQFHSLIEQTQHHKLACRIGRDFLRRYYKLLDHKLDHKCDTETLRALNDAGIKN